MEDEEQHGERHSLENDYEGGTWIDGEFFYRARREKRHQTEDERLYGVFAGDSEDEDEGGGKRRKKSTADYAKPMKFVSKGVVEPKPLEEGQERKSEPTEAAGSHSISAPAEPGSSDASRDQDDGDADEVLPTAFGRSLKKSIAERRLKQQKQQEASQIRKAVLQADPGLAQFEKTTKGIGSKLLGMMGWKPGEGLGRDRTGRAKPIEVRQRPKDMGLGFDNFQEQPKPAPRAPGPLPDAKTAATAQSQKRGRGSRWRKTQVGVRAKVQYRTPEEVLAEAAAEAAETGAVTEAPQKILDMRGRRVKVLRSLEQLEGVEAEGDEDVDGGGAAGPMPELQHNLQLLVEMAEADIRRLDGRLSSEKDSVVLLGSEGQQLQQRKRLADAELSKMGDLYDRVRRCAQESKTMALESIEQEFLKLQAAFREEYVLFSLPAAALAAGLPHIRERLAAWRPLAQPQAALPLFRTWQRLLQTDSERQAVLARGLDPLGDLAGSSYGLLVLECLLPPLRQDVLETWHPREPEALLNFLDLWEGVLPQAAAAHICEGLVMPRLHAAVEAWQPTRDTVPIHHWLHPWLPHLGPQLENVYPHIRHKVAAALEHWVPNDGSAIVLLEPWAVVFKGQDWEQLMARSILPKLSSALQSLDCAPTSTHLEPFDWVMAWEKLMPLELMAALLDHYFFPRWHQTLHFWLNHSPDYDEVTSWYLGWKRRFPESIWSHERILAHNKAALNVINQAQHGHMPTQYDIPLPGPAPFALAGGGGNAAAAAASYAAAGAAAGAAAAPEPELSLKQAVEMYAAEHGVEFQPKPGRYFQGKPVYSFGGISMVIDSTAAVLRANLGSGYLPISLAQLAQEYASRAPAAVAR